MGACVQGDDEDKPEGTIRSEDPEYRTRKPHTGRLCSPKGGGWVALDPHVGCHRHLCRGQRSRR